MPAIAIRRTAWNNGNRSQKWAMRLAGEKVELGEPAVYKHGTVRELVFHSVELTLMDVAILGTVAAGLSAHANWTVPTVTYVDDAGQIVDTGRVDRREGRRQVANFVRANLVKPRDVTINEGDDPYTVVLAAQGAPSWLKAAQSVPASWTPVEVT